MQSQSVSFIFRSAMGLQGQPGSALPAHQQDCIGRSARPGQVSSVQTACCISGCLYPSERQSVWLCAQHQQSRVSPSEICECNWGLGKCYVCDTGQAPLSFPHLPGGEMPRMETASVQRLTAMATALAGEAKNCSSSQCYLMLSFPAFCSSPFPANWHSQHLSLSFSLFLFFPCAIPVLCLWVCKLVQAL